ncbi:autotransporter outer membrane beta-barrel domain-containing protein, partial [Fusobacterium ulcerans]
MIEKIMKAVKSGNKKRGRNITIGAVVGMLLSCTVVMGADVVGLEIKESDGNITFTPGIDEGTYPDNKWDEKSATYTNNSGISAENNIAGKACGLKLSGDLSEMSFINNGSITATGVLSSYSEVGYGIYNEDGSIGSITNTGKISGNYYGIYNSNSSSGSTSSITSLKNSGSISSSNYGIGNYTDSGTSSITSLINTGSISASMRGIYNARSSSIGEIINSGTISANTGIDNESSGSIGNLKNSGIIYGQYTAISNQSSSETISNANNYGLLVSSNTSQNVVNNITIVDSSASATTNEIKNYGLAFIADSNKYIGGGSDSGSPVDYHNNFGEIHQISIDGVSYDIINVDAEVDAASKEIKNWKSLTLEEGKLTYYDSNGASDKEESISPDKKYILNGIEDTLKISGRKNELNNSVVNAYKTAVVMDQEMSMLTLDNTVVNGGVADGSTTISITENGSTLTIKGDSVINTRDKGVAITVDGNDNAVTLEGNAIVNGKMESKGNNILNLYGKADGS